MKTETSAALLYHEQFLNIVQHLQKQEKPQLKIIKINSPEAPSGSIADAVNNPANWDANWFANYE